MPDFSHLHVHTQFSLLDGAADIGRMFKKAANDGMKAMAITDHGNMFGVFKFVAEAAKHGVKPIVGCEFYVVEDRHIKQFTKEKRDKRYHQLMLAKNPQGYKNLIKLCSLGYMEGIYSKWPRIDKELILKYHEGLIATTCCLGAVVPQYILNKSEEEAEEEFKWWLDLFGEDFYIELQRHNLPEQEKVNAVLLKFAKKYQVKMICSNDSHYVDQEDSNAHDILLCVNTGDLQSTPIATDEEGGKGYRFGFPNDQFFFKTQAEMSSLFHDIPEAVDNTNEIVDKIETLQLKRDIMLPNFPIPDEYKIHKGPEADKENQWEYLKHLTYLGAKERYKDIVPEVQERIDFELFTIKTMGFAGYFLIVADFIKAGRDLGVFIGPGRGSAAGSVVAYCTGITNIDPIKYNLLFERFLNPDRKSMPDIDTDFDDEGRQKVIDYVVDKYGKNQVAQIITYGSMAAKSSIKDVARVLDLPLSESNALAKLVPDRPGTNLNKVISLSTQEIKQHYGQDFENIQKLQEFHTSTNSMPGKVLKEALILEGSVRNVGIHAAGIIIAPEDLTNIIPVSTSKESNLLITQYDGRVIEDAGVIKMDFLGLKTLTIIKNALSLIKQNYNEDIIIDDIPLDDLATFELYQRGDTNGTFQFESDGMQKYLRELKPDKFEDLIAMNALYRPGPMDYIPSYIKRKHGREDVSYDLADMEEYLADTYGITVYQEQVMLLSQKLADFSKGDADVLRKAMGKKDRHTLDKLKPQFVENAKKKGHDVKVLEKVWTDWEAFASYAFNKSHSTCYAFVAYQTAYLKAHYPSEYMAAVLNNQNNLEKISFFMEECRKIGVMVLGPDVNESDLRFNVNKKKEIRFGLSGIKGVGDKAVESIIEERKENGPYTSIYDFARRVNSRTVSKKVYENLVYSGAFDCFNLHRAQFFFIPPGATQTGIDRLVKYTSDYQNNKDNSAMSLFGGTSDADIPEPTLSECPDWDLIVKLKYEKDVIGIYLTGHPLDNYRVEMEHFCPDKVELLHLIEKIKGEAVDEEVVEGFNKIKNKEMLIGGLVSSVQHRTTRNGKPFGIFVFEDYADSYEIAVFGEDYVKFREFLHEGYFLQLRATVRERFGQKGNWELKLLQIQLLDELRDKLAKHVVIKLSLNEISPGFLLGLKELVERNAESEGVKNCELKFEIKDHEDRIRLDMPSKSIRVNPDNEFLDGLKKMNLNNVRLN
ncbi:DNA polymerase III subunit alpha [Albibacterium sp.]|uniref:DNA polymerase III subunit alpha n=1 Tax=Albibacterium sp. TaxID=2952885 RepID=UPI002C7A1910|nr:DNA polymerase III subunit alpha [Albibacterium sp.]HUH19478.1 DNA polymerase III subunit alpha [Albibacterium sp.]